MAGAEDDEDAAGGGGGGGGEEDEDAPDGGVDLQRISTVMPGAFGVSMQSGGPML